MKLKRQTQWAFAAIALAVNVLGSAVCANALRAYPSGVQLASQLDPASGHYEPAPNTRLLYVSPTGSSNLCSPRVPCAVGKAIAKANVGGYANVIFLSGVYELVIPYDITSPSVTLQAAPEATVWIEGSRKVEAWAHDTNNGFWSTNSTYFELGARTESPIFAEDINSLNPLAPQREAVFINDYPLWQVASAAALRPGAFYVDIVSHRLWIADDPNVPGTTVKIIRRSEDPKNTDPFKLEYAFRFFPGVNSTADGGRVRGLGFRYFADAGVQMKGNHMVLEGNTFAWNGDVGAAFATYADGLRHSTSNPKQFGFDNVARGNKFIANGRNGLRVVRQDRFTLENNYFAHNNVERYRTAWSASAIKMTGTYDSTITNNIFEKNYATAIWLDLSNRDIRVTNNDIRNNSFTGEDLGDIALTQKDDEACFGIHAELSHQLQISHNTIDDNASAGVYISESSLARVEDNSILNSRKDAIRIKESPRDSSIQYKDRAQAFIDEDQFFYITWNTWGNAIHRNVLHRVSIQNDALFNAYDSKVHVDNCPNGWIRVPRYVADPLDENPGYATVCSNTGVAVRAMDYNKYFLPTAGRLVLWGPQENYSNLDLFKTVHPGYETNGTVSFEPYR